MVCPSPAVLQSCKSLGIISYWLLYGLNLRSLDAGTDLQRGLEKYLPCKEVYSRRRRYVILLLNPERKGFISSFIAPALPSELAAFTLLHEKKGRERNIWTQLLHLTWGSPVDAQWNPHHHCFQASQQNIHLTPVSAEEKLLLLPVTLNGNLPRLPDDSVLIWEGVPIWWQKTKDYHAHLHFHALEAQESGHHSE